MIAFLNSTASTARRNNNHISTSNACDDGTPTDSATFFDLIVDAVITNTDNHTMHQQMLDNYLKNQEIIARRLRNRSAGIHAAKQNTPKSPRHPTFQMYASRKRCVSRWTKPPNFWSWR